MRKMSGLIGAVAGFVLLAGSAVAQQNPQHSGFLGNAYAKMQDAQSPSGAKVKRWITPGDYDSLLLDKTVFYPLPKSTDQLSSATLNEISSYLDEALRRELSGAAVKLVTEPGPKTLRVRPAITAAAPKSAGLKPYQLLPIAFIVTGGKTAQHASLAVEYEALDSETNQVVGAGMREGMGLELKTAKDTLTLAQFKPVIDTWAKDMRAFIDAAKAKK